LHHARKYTSIPSGNNEVLNNLKNFLKNKVPKVKPKVLCY